MANHGQDDEVLFPALKSVHRMHLKLCHCTIPKISSDLLGENANLLRNAQDALQPRKQIPHVHCAMMVVHLVLFGVLNLIS